MNVVDKQLKNEECHIRVPYGHVDKMGFVYYGNYFLYFEIARTEFLRKSGYPYEVMESEGLMLPVVKAHCEYKKSAKYDDLLLIRSQFELEKKVRLNISYEVFSCEQLLATGYTQHVCMTSNGRLVRMPEKILKLC